MYYLRRDKNHKPIYLCPCCGANINPSKDLLDYILFEWHAKGGRTAQNKLTPEQRKAKAIKAINTRWHKQSTEGQ